MTDPGRVAHCKNLRDAWMTHLRVAVDDADAVALDMLRSPNERQLGPAKHRELYASAASKLAYLLANQPPDADEVGHDANLRRDAIVDMADGLRRQRAAEVAEMDEEDEEERRAGV